MNQLTTVGNRIKQIRLNLGLSMEEFGKRLDTSKGAVNNWEKGVNFPNKERLKKIADLANKDINWLLWGSFKEYMSYYLLENGYKQFLHDFPETIDIIANNLEFNSQILQYPDYNDSIRRSFNKVYLPIFYDYSENVIDIDIQDYLNKPHSISPEQFKARFLSKFRDGLIKNGLKYGEEEKIRQYGIALLEHYDSSYPIQQQYTSIDDYFSSMTATQIETEKLVNNLCKHLEIPFKKNSNLAKILFKNHNQF